MNYIPNYFFVESVELVENDNINIVLTYFGCEEYEKVVVPSEIWEMDSYEVYKSWINLLIETENELERHEYVFDGKVSYTPVKPIEVTALKFTGRNYNEVKEFC